MPKIFYIDSNIFISFVREEIDSSFNYLYLDAKNFFAFCAEEKHSIMLSSLFFSEIEKIIHLQRKDVLEQFELLKVNVLFASMPSEELADRIEKECSLHYADAAHVAFACKNNADVIVTWNKKDFMKARNFKECFTPSEILGIL